MNYNRVQLAGNLTRDPEIKYLPSGVPIASFTIASTRKWKSESGEKKEETAFVDCTAFGKTAEVIVQYHKKGHPIFIEGRLKLDQWDDKASGQKRSKLTVIAESFQFLKAFDGADNGAAATPAPARGKFALTKAGGTKVAADGKEEEDSVPF